ncbi:MAG TPA: 50S ribosomal protein L15 [Candidatus Saccharimonadales bacterium]|nr:50S ribosomal protein L15 [Candidatus Saccharimonadales bacterium]
MKFNELNISANKSGKRVGRGIAAGQGKTAGRGTKGQMSRTGAKRKPGFEGGQNPLMQRLPKLHGFKAFKAPVEAVYTGDLDALKGTIDTNVLAEAGLISNPYVRVKLIVKGEVTKKHDVKLQAASESAIEAIQKAGGSFEKVARAARPATRRKKED